MNHAELIEKVRKLRALADNAGTIAEAATAAAMAEAIIQKYAIEEAELELTLGSQEQVHEDQVALTCLKQRQTVLFLLWYSSN